MPVPPITITMDDNGNVTVNGPISSKEGKRLCYEMIIKAAVAICEFDPTVIVAPPPGLHIVKS